MVTDQLQRRRARHFALTIGATLALLGVGAAPGSASAGAEGQGAQLLQGVEGGEQRCEELSRDQLETVGEYVMGRMLGSAARHEAMDEQIRATAGASGEAEAHVFMGRRFTGCATGAAPAAFGSMMGMMGNYSGANGGGMGNRRDGGYGFGMMGGSGSRADGDSGWNATNTVLVILLVVLVVLAAALAARRRTGRPSPKTALEVLGDRYASGDIDTADYEQRRRALEGPT